MSYNITSKQFLESVTASLKRYFGVKAEDASKEQIYQAICFTVRNILTETRVEFKNQILKQQTKQVYYMSMEFLLGRSLKNHLYNMGLLQQAQDVCKALNVDINDIYAFEPDAGLGNGGLGRLAAAYMDALTSENYAVSGFSILYDYGIFKQVVVDGWQLEQPDEWLKLGNVWCLPRTEETYEVKFGGRVEEKWDDKGNLKVEQHDYMVVLAVPYDMEISGYNTSAVNHIRLWASKAPVDFDMAAFSRGEYVKAMTAKAMAESISKVLYPADNHIEGKSLRLKQQYFFVSASVQSIIRSHMKRYGKLSNFADKVAIHINDTHPTLCIPELMRIFLDEYGMSWEDAWDIVKEVISYTNHTVMSEALERWPEDLIKMQLPRIYQIICEINRRFCQELWEAYPNNWDAVQRNAIIANGEIRMANLCLATSHTINGVSELHSDILKNDVFREYYAIHPDKFTNVTNGITHRRWTDQANPKLGALITECIGDKWLTKPEKLEELLKFQGNKQVLDKLAKIKYDNKVDLAQYIKDTKGIIVDPSSMFDVQVKRIHEYKRQLLNAIHILDLYFRLKDNPNLDIAPRTFIFGGKAASAYYIAKQVIRFICALGNMINNDTDINGKIKVVFLDNYRVTLAEMIMPAAEVSEQISLAGKEASGTGNMKFMINGALTIGTLDGANVEMSHQVGEDNIFIFGLRAHEVEEKWRYGYNPTWYYNSDARIKRIIDALRSGIGGVTFPELADSLTVGYHSTPDGFMVLADFATYADMQQRVNDTYKEKEKWNRMSLNNIAKAGFFAADRAVKEYADRIWGLIPLKLK